MPTSVSLAYDTSGVPTDRLPDTKPTALFTVSELKPSPLHNRSEAQAKNQEVSAYLPASLQV